MKKVERKKVKILFRFLALMAAVMIAQPVTSQVPAGAPAGTTGLCKDGTYSTAASKSGACGGHKGVKTWYAAAAAPKGSTTAAKPATTTTTTAAKPATPATPATPGKPAAPAATTTTAAKPATASTNAGPAAKAAATQQAPGGGPGLVWVNTASNVYHCPGSTYYGKTKAGAYMTEAAAKAKGARPNDNKPCPAK